MYHLIEENRKTLMDFCDRFAVRRLEIFGSAVTERFDPATSDLDFLVELEPASPSEMADRYFGLLAALEDLFARPIDLVMIPAIKNPYFLQGIKPSRTLLYAA